ncbi:MAG: AAA family ATPase [Pyrinomonadaceae bacterium]|nr:AAA family ATPase [Phycisphaerales bacterium]
MTHALVILIGLRGSGKTTVGRLVAARGRCRFVDLDTLTPTTLGCATVAAAWSQHGEPRFREAELTALRSVMSETSPCILALGGGTPTAPGAADLLNRARSAGARIIYLRATPSELSARLLTSDNTHRPSLTGLPSASIEEITRVHQARDALYLSLADLVVEVGGLSTQEVADAILEKI